MRIEPRPTSLCIFFPSLSPKLSSIGSNSGLRELKRVKWIRIHSDNQKAFYHLYCKLDINTPTCILRMNIPDPSYL